MANALLTAGTELQSLVDKKEKILNEAGNKIASVMISMNESGDNSVNKIMPTLDKLLTGFTLEEKYSIILRASAKVIATL